MHEWIIKQPIGPECFPGLCLFCLFICLFIFLFIAFLRLQNTECCTNPVARGLCRTAASQGLPRKLSVLNMDEWLQVNHGPDDWIQSCAGSHIKRPSGLRAGLPCWQTIKFCKWSQAEQSEGAWGASSSLLQPRTLEDSQAGASLHISVLLFTTVGSESHCQLKVPGRLNCVLVERASFLCQFAII